MKIKTIIKKSNEKYQITEIDNGLESLQDAVGGYIEAPFFPILEKHGITMFINEEGKLLDLPPSIAVIINGELFDFICGNAVFTSSDDDGNTTSLNNEQIEIIEKLLNNSKKCMTSDGILLDVIEM